jgi:hypothetical protein
MQLMQGRNLVGSIVLLQLKLAVLKYRHYKLNKLAKTMKIFEQLENLKNRWVSYWH